MSDVNNYPASLDIDYPERLDRVKTFFRPILAVPILIILALLIGGSADHNAAEGVHYVGAVGILFLPALLMILFRKKYPKWWFDWNLALVKFSNRVIAYLLLLRDEYPSTDEEQAVHIEIPYPDVEKELKRGMPLVKWFLALPHLVVLIVLYVAVLVCTLISWFAILFTGKYPKSLFDFVVGVMRWSIRVEAYAFLLTTDRYPPFSLD